MPTLSLGRKAALVLAACGLTACGGAPDAAARTATELRARLASHALTNEGRCSAAGERSRWAGGAAYRLTAAYGAGADDGLGSLAGVAVHGDTVFAYDAVRSRVVVLSAGLRPLGAFGREGEGPGELAQARDRSLRMRAGSWRWIDAAGGTLVVFDGWRASRFSTGGDFRARAEVPAPAAPVLFGGYPRIRAADSTLYLASALVVIDSGRPQRWTVGRLREGGLEPLLGLTLPALPRWRSGATFRGPTQARPLWELAAGCVVASDGTSPWIVRRPLAGGAADSLPIPLPDRDPPKVDEREYLQDLNSGPGPDVRSLPKPTALWRVLDLIADPDGYLWILPVQPRGMDGGRVEVLRVAVGSGRTETDTVPAFPLAFGPPGVYYAAATDADGVVSVVRYQRR
jgi:hypothetical protein